MSHTATGEIPTNLQTYLDEITQRLLSGHAAVMVGSGFSRNASPDFPTWNQLGDILYKILHGEMPGNDIHYLDVPTLAHEVEAALGRPALDRILHDAIPDLASDPSPLHIQLLELHWADVLTTNYDTLLERARSSVSSRRYEVVTNSEDLGNSRKPRVIKLHGSFSSDPKYIVTDEDYRRYPKENAPFVNTVLQTLLENTLCLVGFSCDDPNFLHWIGWMHDNLGRENAPKMYLVGVLHLSRSQKSLLEQRNIVPIDMSECPDIGDNHSKALERFFDYLRSTTIEDSLGWPIDNNATALVDQPSGLSDLARIWKEQRLTYPGWVIVPKDRRDTLWHKTEHTIRDLPTHERRSDFVDLEFAFELTWRLEKCLCPLFLFKTQVQFLEDTINRYLPFVRGETPPDSSFPNEISMNAHNLTHQEIRNMMHHLLLALIRHYREQGRSDEWRDKRNQLESIKASISPEHAANLHYEYALIALLRLDLQDLKAQLSEWPNNISLSFWCAKKAGLLAEIGQMEEARNLLQNALDAIRARSSLAPTTTDFSLVSQESFVMLLLSCVQRPWFFRTDDQDLKVHDTQKGFSERWHALRQYKCDPWNELGVFERALDGPQSNRTPIETSTGFDIGHKSRTYRFGNWDRDALTAYAFLRFCEDIGLPFRVPGRTIATESAKGAFLRIQGYTQAWSNTILVRISDRDAVRDLFDRHSLAGMDASQVDNLVNLYLRALDIASSDISSGDRFGEFNFGVALATVVPEILSRLCSKCSDDVRERLLDFLVRTYNSDQRGKFLGIRELTRRLVESFSASKHHELIPKLLEFPILTGLTSVEEQEYVNPFIFLDTRKCLGEVDLTIDDQTWNRIIEGASGGNSSSRRWAISTLRSLHELGLLDLHRKKVFADVLWQKVNKSGFPTDTDIRYQDEVLTLPHPVDVDPVTLFKAHVARGEFPIETDSTHVSIGRLCPLCTEIYHSSELIEWSDHDIRSIIDRLVQWWDSDKKYLRRSRNVGSDALIFGELKGRFSALVDTAVAVLSRDLGTGQNGETRQKVRRLIGELADFGIPEVRLDAVSLHMFPDRGHTVIETIEKRLSAGSDEFAGDAFGAILVVAKRLDMDSDVSKNEDFLRLMLSVSQVLQWRSKVGLSDAISTMAYIIKIHPWILSSEIERSLLLGLEGMLVETAYSRSIPYRSAGKDDLDISTKLVVRQKAAGLAFILYSHYVGQGKVIPDVISSWQAICDSDYEFAEIRNEWCDVPSI